jgi:dienelactone hydrolase
MSAEPLLTSDVIGLTKTAPFSRRGFMTASAAVAAGYTLAAAPHGFHADYRASYRKEAAEDGWNQMQVWFNKYGVLG